jgi:biopolymer transport protein ExbD
MNRPATTYDVWITASNRAYSHVPFGVVTDWLQQGRLLATDRVRLEGGEWQPVAECEALRPFLPRRDAPGADDAAEAFEPVVATIPLRRPADDDDDDVDMIPLIDISLVLLIFFMMTATVAVGGARIDTPQTQHGVEFSQDRSMLWIGIDRRDDGRPVYSLGQGDMQADAADSGLSFEQLLQRLDARLANHVSGAVVRVAAHRQIAYGVVQKLTAELEKRRRTGHIGEIKAEVNERST